MSIHVPATPTLPLASVELKKVLYACLTVHKGLAHTYAGFAAIVASLSCLGSFGLEVSGGQHKFSTGLHVSKVI